MDAANNVLPVDFSEVVAPPSQSPTMADMDVDMDIDVDLDDDPEIARLQAEAAALNAQPSNYAEDGEPMNGIDAEAEEGEVNPQAPVAKVHVRVAVSDFKPGDAKSYANEHYPTDQFDHVQWVNDTSFNFVYKTEAATAEALEAFSAEDVIDALELRPAKRFSARPDADISVRQAVVGDVKVKNAHIHSTFYLRNPEFDPESRPRKRRYDDYRKRDYDYGRRPRRDAGDDMYQRRASQDVPFDVDLYDDNAASKAAVAERRQSRSSESSAFGRKRLRFQDDLMGARNNGRLRNRSASPLRDGDGRFGFREDGPRRPTARPRSQTPPRFRARGRDNRDNISAADQFRKDLFPDKVRSSNTSRNDDDLFPHRVRSPQGPKELFPNHKRSDAHDYDNEYPKVEQRMSRYSLNEGDQQANYGYAASAGSRGASKKDDKPRDLMSRITGGPKAVSTYGRLGHDVLSTSNDDSGYSIKGAGGSEFSFKGASNNGSALVKELFPRKSNGEKKDLFDGRIKGRANRRRAEDFA
ncbi:hypothetical protein EJ03DRAFT_39137 [Teratosphaeria nubilosa]|uniref:Uncharacterized protein n=1 Tax=Teratosphaeria nubilosa TaxID=161662 RepID=A0A6G1LEG7_9PEZI|nr:hypothetical protein EJ03DRAFT_39137 [Teratosphaeria nubilosa]